MHNTYTHQPLIWKQPYLKRAIDAILVIAQTIGIFHETQSERFKFGVRHKTWTLGVFQLLCGREESTISILEIIHGHYKPYVPP